MFIVTNFLYFLVKVYVKGTILVLLMHDCVRYKIVVGDLNNMRV